VCLGKDFALMEVSYTIVRVLLAVLEMGLPEDEMVGRPLGMERQRLTVGVGL
jgi:hypothetical protein